MLFKVGLLVFSIPSTVVGGYFLTKNFDVNSVVGSQESYYIVRSQKPLAYDVFQSSSSTRLWENNNRRFKCAIKDVNKISTYDNSCVLYTLKNGNNSSPQIIDVDTINNNFLDPNKKVKVKSDIKENDFYLLKINPYVFQNINNLTNVQLVEPGDTFLSEKELGNFRVESPVFGGGKTTGLSGHKNITFTFGKKFKSNLVFAKLIEKDTAFKLDHSLKCYIGNAQKSCDAWKVDSANKNTNFSGLTIQTATKVSSDGELEKDKYYILEINTNQLELEEKSDIKFSNKSAASTDTNKFQILSGMIGNYSETTKTSGQFIFISSETKITE